MPLRSVRTRVALVLAALAAALIVSLGVGAQVARADVILPIVADPIAEQLYPIDVDEACRTQYPNAAAATANYSNYLNPYTWFCQAPTQTNSNIGIGASKSGVGGDLGGGIINSVLGGIDLSLWCSQRHPGTYSSLRGVTVFDWVCEETPA